MPNASGQLQDAYTARHRMHTEDFHAGRWGTHMAGRMARQLREGADGERLRPEIDCCTPCSPS